MNATGKQWIAALLSVILLIGVPVTCAVGESQYIVTNVLRLGPLTPDDADSGTYTVTFVVGDTSWEKVVDADTLLGRPADPTPPDDAQVHFTGWYTDDDVPFDFFLPITGDMTLTARFSEAYLVEFLDMDGLVTHVESVVENEQATAYDPTNLVIPADQQFLYWYVDGTDSDSAFDFSSPITANLRLAPKLTAAMLAIFVSEGTQVPAQVIDVTKPITEPTIEMMRPGYTFQHWSKKEGSADAYGFDVLETKPVRLYAVWEKTKVDYTIIYWKEQPNIDRTPVYPDEYMYAFNSVVTGTVDVDTVIPMNADIAISKVTGADKTYLQTHFEYFTSDQEVVAVGDGSAVVNVYYNRKIHTVTFRDYLKGAKSISTIKDGTITSDSYAMKVKLDQSVSAIWPSDLELINPGNIFQLWSSYYNFSRPAHDIFSEGMYTTICKLTNSSASNMRLYARYAAPDKDFVYRRYFLEVLGDSPAAGGASEPAANGKIERYGNANYKYDSTYTTSSQQKTTTSETSGYKGWPGTTGIPGFRPVNQDKNGENVVLVVPNPPETLESTGQNVYYLHYYMPRLSYTLTLNAQGGTVNGETSISRDNIPYETPLPQDMINAVPLKDNATFEGWYYDLGFDPSSRVKDTDTMPHDHLILYAKFSNSGVIVRFYDSETASTPMITKETAPGGLVKAPEDFVLGEAYPGKGLFDGWKFKTGGIPAPFSNSMPITGPEPLDVYATWKPDQYTVTYYRDEAGTEVYHEIRVPSTAGSITGSRQLTPENLTRDGATFRAWYENADGTGTRFTGVTPVTDDVSVYPSFATLPTVTASDVYVETNPSKATGGVLNWHDMVASDVLTAANAITATGHTEVTVASSEIDFSTRTDYAPGTEYPLTITVHDSMDREATTSVNLHVTDSTSPAFTSNGRVTLRAKAGLTEAEFLSGADLEVTDDYAAETFLLNGITSNFATALTDSTVPGLYTITYQTSDTVGNTGTHDVELLLWGEAVTADPLILTVSQVADMDDDKYIAQMNARGAYITDTQTVSNIVAVDATDVLPIIGSYTVNFTGERGTVGGNTVTVVADTYLVTPSVIGGTISPAQATVYDYGNNATITYAPNRGWRLVSVKVDGQDVTATSRTSHTFAGIDADHTVDVVYEGILYQLKVRHLLQGTTTELAPSTVQTLGYGDGYTVPSLKIADHVALQASVTGTMPDRNMETVLYYAPVATPVPAATPAPTDTPRPAPQPVATDEPEEETETPTPTPAPTARVTPVPSASAPAIATPPPEDVLPLPPAEAIDAYNPEEPPVAVVEARERKRSAVFILYDSDIPLAGVAARSMGDNIE